MHDNQNYSKVNFNIAITGILLGLALLFQYISNFMGISDIMTINLSLAFIAPIFFAANYKFGMLAIVTKFVIGIFMNPGAPFGLAGEAIGQLILLVAGLIYIHLVILFKKLKLSDNKHAMIIGLGLVTVLSALIMTTLNGALFVPMYNAVIGFGFTFNTGDIWGISQSMYWAIIFAVFIVGNLANYGITSLALIPIFKIVRPHLQSKN